ncbi:MAG TPA: transposase [Burkholderiales bacterium]|nr:transposase [Burkholderiales bacterium]
MSIYRRARVEGGSYFFTVTLADRTSTLLVDRIEVLRRAFAMTRAELPFRIDCVVVLPDHLHCIWTLPHADSDYSSRWQRIKGRFSRACPAGEAVTASRRSKRERGIWHRRYWEHVLRDERDFSTHVDYIHWNPVKHSHVPRVSEWPHSSFHRYVREGVLPVDWGGECSRATMGHGQRYGERES